MRMVANLFEKMPEIYQKIPENREMSFRSSENKKWTFRGSFDNFLGIFPVLSRIFDPFSYFYTRINEYLSQHVWCENDK